MTKIRHVALYPELVKAADFQSIGPVFETTGWLQARLSLSFFRGR